MDTFMRLWPLPNRSQASGTLSASCGNRSSAKELTQKQEDSGNRRYASSVESKVQSVVVVNNSKTSGTNTLGTLVNLSKQRPPPTPDSSAATSVIISKAGAVEFATLRNSSSQQNWQPKSSQNLIQNGESRPAFRAVITSSCRPTDSPNTAGGMNPQINPQYFVDEAESLANPADFACGKRSTLVIAAPSGNNRKRAAVEVPVVSWSSSSIRDLSATGTHTTANGGGGTNTCSAEKYQTAGGAVPTSAAVVVATAASQQNQQAGHTGVSPVPSLSCSDIGEMDLDFWDVEAKLDSNGIAHPLPQQQQNATTVLVNHISSPNSSQLQQQSQQQLRQAQLQHAQQQQLYSQGEFTSSFWTVTITSGPLE